MYLADPGAANGFPAVVMSKGSQGDMLIQFHGSQGQRSPVLEMARGREEVMNCILPGFVAEEQGEGKETAERFAGHADDGRPRAHSAARAPQVAPHAQG